MRVGDVVKETTILCGFDDSNGSFDVINAQKDTKKKGRTRNIIKQ